MLCDICHKNEAVLFVEQTFKNSKNKLNFCYECVSQYGNVSDPQELTKAINSVLNIYFKGFGEADVVCPVCGEHLYSIISKGIAGCPECYQIFKEQIKSYMEKHKIYGCYTGLMPKRLSSFKSVLTDRNDVLKKLEIAVENEDYEKAAFYRDYLHAIENKALTQADSDE